MTIYRARLSKDGLRQLPSAERKLFLTLGHAVNEVNALRKLLFWSSDFSDKNDVVTQGRITFALIFVRLLAGKTKEANELIKKRFLRSKVLSQGYLPLLSPKGREALAKLKRLFGGSNLISSIRNDFAFHYSPDAIDAALNDLSDDLDLYIEDKGQANTLYYCSEVLAGRALLKSLGAVDDPEAFNRLMEETISAADAIHNFAEAFMEAFLARHRAHVWDGHAEPVELGELGNFMSTRLNWFADIADLLVLKGGVKVGGDESA